MTEPQVGIAHLPTPSVGPGSTILTVVGELLESARARGLDHRVLIEPWRGRDLPPEQILATASPRQWVSTRPGALTDHALGRTIGRRPVARELYRSARRGLELGRIGHVVLHDGSYGYGGVEDLAARGEGFVLGFSGHGRRVGGETSVPEGRPRCVGLSTVRACPPSGHRGGGQARPDARADR